jgi:hypothetical protein
VVMCTRPALSCGDGLSVPDLVSAVVMGAVYQFAKSEVSWIVVVGQFITFSVGA